MKELKRQKDGFIVKDENTKNLGKNELRTITNARYDNLANQLDDFLLDELEVTIDASKTTELMNLILNNLGLRKE